MDPNYRDRLRGDAWRAKQDSPISRAEAIRRLVEIALVSDGHSIDRRLQTKASESAAEAKKLAAELGLEAKE